MTAKDIQKQSIIFWGYQSFRAKLGIISVLIKIDHGKRYETFSSSLLKMIGNTNDVRNRIVHWHHMDCHRDGQVFNPDRDTFLEEPPPGSRALYKHELIDFSKKADFLASLTFSFVLHLRVPKQRRPGKKPWQEVFAESVIYPPPADHPAVYAQKSDGKRT